MILQKLGINNDKKFYLVLGGILFFFIILLEFQMSYRQLRTIKNQQKEIQVKQQKNRIDEHCIILHNKIIKNTSIQIANLNVEIMRFMKKQKHTLYQCEQLIKLIHVKLNKASIMLDQYNSTHSIQPERNVE